MWFNLKNTVDLFVRLPEYSDGQVEVGLFSFSSSLWAHPLSSLTYKAELKWFVYIFISFWHCMLNYLLVCPLLSVLICIIVIKNLRCNIYAITLWTFNMKYVSNIAFRGLSHQANVLKYVKYIKHISNWYHFFKR